MTDKKITELNLKSATYYGAQLQMNHFTEELAELIQAAAEGDPDMSKDEVQIKRQTANHDLETDIGELVSYLNWLAGRYSIAAEEIREIKSYKVQRTRDRIELETGSICKKLLTTRRLHRPRI